MSDEPVTKRAKVESFINQSVTDPSLISSAADSVNEVLVQFKTVDGLETGPQLSIPLSITPAQLQILINKLLDNSDRQPYSFYINEEEIIETLLNNLQSLKLSTENILTIIYQPQSLFRVRSVSRCSSTLPGHNEAILSISYSPSSKYFVSGSGDCTMRIWDATTSTPLHVCRGHRNHVLCANFSPNERLVATGSMDCDLRIWSASSGQMLGKVYKGHTKWISSLSWEPLHKNGECSRIATGSKDGTIRIWDLVHRQCLSVLSGHTGGITCVKWGGEGLLYSASQDRTIKVWSIDSSTGHGKLVRTLEGHAHWVNHLSLSTDYVMKLNAYDQRGKLPESEDKNDCIKIATERFNDCIKLTGGHEMLVSGSEDFTLLLWNPVITKHPILRMTGHQQPVNWVSYSPDTRIIASASFDKSVKLWHGHTGKFLSSLRGHVGSIYQVCWSSDSRLLCSSSKDSTMKIWNIKDKKMEIELPGHADEVFACDWSGNGEQVASGGKDRVVKVWRN